MNAETLTPQCETRSERPSRTRKALVSVLGGLGIFAATNIHSAVTDDHNDRVWEKRDTAAQEEKEKIEISDYTHAKIAWAMDLRENSAENNAE